MMNHSQLEVLIKRNPVTQYLSNIMLNLICKDVRAYIFVATTGRSGSSSLSNLFAHVEGVASFHEPFPVMNDVNEDDENSSYELDKLFNLKRLIIKRAAAGHQYYFESNHQFIKHFADRAIKEFGNKIRVIHLVREPYKVAKSFYEIGSIPGKTEKGYRWLLDPESDTNLIKLPELLEPASEYSHDYYKCLWYCYETEARIANMIAKNPELPVFKLHINDISSQKKLSALFSFLGIKADLEKVSYYAKYKSNEKKIKKIFSIEVDDCIIKDNKIKELISSHIKE